MFYKPDCGTQGVSGDVMSFVSSFEIINKLSLENRINHWDNETTSKAYKAWSLCFYY